MYKTIRDARKNEGGFTLIELLIVIVILGVLAGIVVFAVNGINDKGEVSACRANVKTVNVAAESFYAKSANNQYPADLAAMVTGGFLHSAPTDVNYVVAAGGKSYTATGLGVCAGYTG
ncbi:competence type IV pilus major pilin ComGC [Actinophytocola sp.]|uniref:competence type IV pilus major pilin ComGC n=1 Tax=Actinophytocola sp. TaxID=1872138 RepID=UPI002ECFB056